MPVLDAANREAVCPVIAVHIRIRAVEVQVSGVRSGHRTTPVVAVRTHIVERPIAVIPVAACCLKWLFNSSRFLSAESGKPLFGGNTLPGFCKKAIGLILTRSPGP